MKSLRRSASAAVLLAPKLHVPAEVAHAALLKALERGAARFAHLLGEELVPLFENARIVDVFEHPAQPPREVPRDDGGLEVDQAGRAVRADDEVTRAAKVEVRDAARVHLIDQGFEALHVGEIHGRTVHALFAHEPRALQKPDRQRLTVDEEGFARDAVDAFEAREHRRFAAQQERPHDGARKPAAGAEVLHGPSDAVLLDERDDGVQAPAVSHQLDGVLGHLGAVKGLLLIVHSGTGVG